MVSGQLRSFWLVCSLLLCSLYDIGCHTNHRDTSQQTAKQDNQSNQKRHKYHRARQGTNLRQDEQLVKVLIQAGKVPAKVRDILMFVRQNNRAPNGFVGGRTFGNFENHLPKQDASNGRIRYQEWDVNPKVKGRNRGAERLITGSDNRAYYTADHYNTFTEIK